MKLMEFVNACGQSLSLKVVTSLSTALYRREDDNQGMDFLYPKGSRQLFYTIFDFSCGHLEWSHDWSATMLRLGPKMTKNSPIIASNGPKWS